MLGFLFGVIVGAVGFWAYQFWKGGGDTSWEQPFPASSTTTSNNYSSRTAETAGTGMSSSEGSTTSPTP